MAYEPVTTTHRTTFKNNVEMALAIMSNPFEPYFTFQSNLAGKTAQVIEYVAPVDPIIDGSRGGATPDAQFMHEMVWCKPRQIEQGTTVEKEDEIKRTISPQSIYVKGIAQSIMRGRRQIMLDSIFGPRLVGADGLQVATAYSATDGVNLVLKNFVRSGSAADSGLTFDKIIKGRTLLVGSEVDITEEKLCLALTHKQEFDLYGMVQYLSKDFREKTVVDEKNKRVLNFLDIDFIRVNQLPLAEAGVRRIPLFCQSAMHYGDFAPLETQLERDPGQKYRLRPYGENWFGATRSEDRKVIEIRCVE